MKQKKVYIFFFETPFRTGKVIRFLTRNKYSHVALSFKPDTKCIYSFARQRYHEPFMAGFGVESTDRYARFDGAPINIRVCEYKVAEDMYRRMKLAIAKYRAVQSLTRYNFIDLLTYPFGKHIKLEYTHTCVSFLAEIIEREDLRTIGQLQRELEDRIIYEGPIDGFEKFPSRGSFDFYERRAHWLVYASSAAVMGSLAVRVVRKIGEDLMEHLA